MAAVSLKNSALSAGRSWPPKRHRVIPLAIGGAALALAGVALVSYAGFQFLGTGMLAARDQERLSAEFEVRLNAGLPEFTGVIAAHSDPVDPAAFGDQDDVPVVITTLEGPPPLPPDDAALEGWLFEAPPPVGTSLGRISIPSIGVDWIIVEGVGVEDLRKGPGHMPNTAMPGQSGNAVISGHRTTYGAPFNRLDELQTGDQFTVQSLSGIHTYEVVSSMIVMPRDRWVTDQWSGAWLTLTTCHPEFTSRQRLIVFSKLVDGPNADLAAGFYGTTYLPPTPGGPMASP